MREIFLDCIIDTLKVVPFLFLTYLLMEVLEHRTGEGTKRAIRRAGRMGPLFGGLLGILPQCGFPAAAAGFFAGRVITVGTLLAVFLSASDEMLPILISSQVPLPLIVRILVIKAVYGVLAGFLIDLLFRRFNQRKIGENIHDICLQDQCQCEDGIVKSALRHTGQIVVFLFLVSLVLNLGIHLIGEENVGGLILNRPFLGELLAGLIGLIPNCAASVVITTFYLDGVMGPGAMMSGLLVGAGVGLLVLFRTNRSLKENIKITGILYVTGVFGGLLTSWLRLIG